MHKFQSAKDVSTSCQVCGQHYSHKIHVQYSDLVDENIELKKKLDLTGRVTCPVCRCIGVFVDVDGRIATHIDERSKGAKTCSMSAQLMSVKIDPTTDIRYRDLIHTVAHEDAERLVRKDTEYGASWKKRGGVGAYFTMIRKVDRLNNLVPGQIGYDIFEHLAKLDVGSESLLDTLRDLRGYLILIEAEHLVRMQDQTKITGHAQIETTTPPSSPIVITGESRFKRGHNIVTHGFVDPSSVKTPDGDYVSPAEAPLIIDKNRFLDTTTCDECGNSVHIVDGKLVVHSIAKDDTRTCSSSGKSVYPSAPSSDDDIPF